MPFTLTLYFLPLGKINKIILKNKIINEVIIYKIAGDSSGFDPQKQQFHMIQHYNAKVFKIFNLNFIYLEIKYNSSNKTSYWQVNC